jgi:hypothetical protein
VCYLRRTNIIYIKIKANLVTGRGGLRDFKLSTIPYCLDNCLTDSCEVFSLTRLPTLLRRHISFLLLIPISVRD